MFDQAVRDGKILNRNFILLTLMFLSPLVLTGAAVYSNRSYADLTIRISKGSSKHWSDDKGKDALQLSKSVTFAAEAKFPGNTAVTWSKDPSGDDYGTLDSRSGEYSSPATMPKTPTVQIFATSVADKTKVARFEFELIAPEKPEEKGRSANSASGAPQPPPPKTNSK